MAETSQIAENEVDPYDGQRAGPYWHAQLESAAKAFEKWIERAKKVVKRYRDERDAIETARKKFNILWSNTQVVIPALYGRKAKPDVSRRYLDNDKVSRVASTMLERVIEYEIENFDDFDAAMKGMVEDRVLPGRGTAWLRYEPTIVTMQQEPQASPSITDDQEAAPNAEPAQRITAAHTPVDYVFWQDFIHSPARTWEEVWWVARWVYMTREEGLERFGEVFKSVPCDSTEAHETWTQGSSRAVRAELEKKAKIAEIWNKRTGRVCWVAKGYPEALDERDDFLKLEGFYPCPKPLFATTTTGSLVPVPDYTEYQDQADEMDNLTQRIAMLTKACKAVGTFNAEYKELQRLLNEGMDNKMFPITDWSAFAEKGGMAGAMQLLDVTPIIRVLQQLYEAREQSKQTVYEVTGLSDILRGATQASETATAQQLKANFGSLRMKSSQQDVARMASDLFRMKGELIGRFYPPELIVKMSGIEKTDDGKDPQLLAAALQLLKSEALREFSIQVESDTLAQIDEAQEKQQAMEFTTAVGTYFKEAVPLVSAAPFMAPLVAELLMFNIRRFRAGRPVEAAFEGAMQQMLQHVQEQQQQPPQPDPQVQKAQADAQKEAAIAAREQQQNAKAAFDKNAELAHAYQVRSAELAQERDAAEEKALLDAAVKILVAQISAKADVSAAAKQAEIDAAMKISESLGQPDFAGMHSENMKALMSIKEGLRAAFGPRKNVPVRGPDGRVAHVISSPMADGTMVQ